MLLTAIKEQVIIIKAATPIQAGITIKAVEITTGIIIEIIIIITTAIKAEEEIIGIIIEIIINKAVVTTITEIINKAGIVGIIIEATVIIIIKAGTISNSNKKITRK